MIDSLVDIGSGNGWSAVGCQAITWVNANLRTIGPLQTRVSWNFNQNKVFVAGQHPFKNVLCEISATFVIPQYAKTHYQITKHIQTFLRSEQVNNAMLLQLIEAEWRQAIIWTSAGILLTELRNKIEWHLNKNSYLFITKMRLKMSSVKWRPFCLGLNVLNHCVRNLVQDGMFITVPGSFQAVYKCAY